MAKKFNVLVYLVKEKVTRCAVQVAEDVLCGSPMLLPWIPHELAEESHNDGEIRARADHEVNKASDQLSEKNPPRLCLLCCCRGTH